MFDINKTLMRCLTKNLAMFGLGLYIYAGEDLPKIEPEPISKDQSVIIKDLINNFKVDYKNFMEHLSTTFNHDIRQIEYIQTNEFDIVVNMLNDYGKSQGVNNV
jgi:hypothetical protein